MKKQNIIETINEFPKEVNLNELFERLIVKEKIDKGLVQIQNGETITHTKVVAHIQKKWQK
jgi:predicted transcriptional regulator